MKFNQLRRTIKRKLPYLKRVSVINKSSIVINVFYKKKIFYLGILPALEYQGWNIEKLESGQWRVFYSERGDIKDITLYQTEEEACNAFFDKI
jgi:hypothetical protein